MVPMSVGEIRLKHLGKDILRNAQTVVWNREEQPLSGLPHPYAHPVSLPGEPGTVGENLEQRNREAVGIAGRGQRAIRNIIFKGDAVAFEYYRDRSKQLPQILIKVCRARRKRGNCVEHAGIVEDHPAAAQQLERVLVDGLKIRPARLDAVASGGSTDMHQPMKRCKNIAQRQPVLARKARKDPVRSLGMQSGSAWGGKDRLHQIAGRVSRGKRGKPHRILREHPARIHADKKAARSNLLFDLVRGMSV